MTNSNESEKCDETKGVILFAFKSADIDYVKIADQTSRLITHYLKLPITLVTDADAVPEFKYDKIVHAQSRGGNYRPFGDKRYEWRNSGRSGAYDYSPYDTTLLLDVDYLVLSPALLKYFDIDNYDYRLQHWSHDGKEWAVHAMGTNALNFIWATTVLFRKTQRSQHLFEMVKRIERNYAYYRALYNANGYNFRNDYAFSMANMIINGYNAGQDQTFKTPMLTIYDPIKSLELKNSLLVIRKEQDATVCGARDLHIIHKEYLLSDSFKQFVDEVTE